jgi:riboflavin kinase/FMN adenylyltransferase
LRSIVVELVRGSSNIAARHRGAIVTIGSFDGLHRGHQALIDATVQRARAADRAALMLTFEPMPREFLQTDPPARLTNFRERWRCLATSGLDALVLLRFDAKLRATRGADFLQLLQRELAVAGVVVGHDFRFGREGEADAAFLAAAGARLGFDVEVVPPVVGEGERVSSSALRAALQTGDFDRAARLLGRRYAMRGRVVAGQQLGRTLGFPTANIRLRRRRIPLGGIFAVRVRGIDGTVRAGVASLGTRPTVGGVEPLLETFVFDFEGDLYGRELEVEFVARLRGEERFESLDELVVQMHADERAARVALGMI